MSVEHHNSQSVGVVELFGVARTAIVDEPLVPVLAVVATVVGAVPLVGGFVQSAVSAFALLVAYKAVGGVVGTDASFLLRYLYLLLASLLGGIMILIGTIVLVIPGIYAALKLTLVVPAVMVDGHGPIDAISESWSRTEGHLPTIFLFSVGLLVVSLLLTVGVLVGLAGAPSDLRALVAAYQSLSGTVLVALVLGLVGSVQVVGIAEMYRRF